ncbi:MAG: alpha-2-macroglobulin, partial [Magnetococcales bacterium]|nr:alpha-2-macroglobulin [Magnetococcales bacterium]
MPPFTTPRRQLAFMGWVLALGSAVFLAPPLPAADALPPPQREAPPVPAGKAVIAPDHFLRAWDPVTLFFDQPTGPSEGGPEDQPERLVKLSPAHPGVYTWLDARTLQFRPVEAWPPLSRFQWKLKDRVMTLRTLMEAPRKTVPEQNAVDLPPVREIQLSFQTPVDAATLARMIVIRLESSRESGGAARLLTSADFSLKEMERSQNNQAARYLLQLREPIPPGTTAEALFRLAEDDREEAFHRLRFSTANPQLRILQAGCVDRLLPIEANGMTYEPEQFIHCKSPQRQVVVRFSSPLAPMDVVQARNLVRLSPPVDDFSAAVSGDVLNVHGKFLSGTLYQVTLSPQEAKDLQGRSLFLKNESRFYLRFPQQAPELKWKEGQGVVERFGPQMIPMQGRNFRRADVRIHPIDARDPAFWPYPAHPVELDESLRPPGPGEEAAASDLNQEDPADDKPRHGKASRDRQAPPLAQRILALGSPAVSEIVPLPIGDGSGSFGLDIAPLLQKIRGENQPGTYLVGLRNLDEGSTRHWVRIQVTDLSLTTVEEDDAVRFVVTSLASGLPVTGAEVRVEGVDSNRKWQTVFSGKTDDKGFLIWKAPGSPVHQGVGVNRLVVRSGEDALVLKTNPPPGYFSDNLWRDDKNWESWLNWTQKSLDHRGESPERLCHLYPERPVIRPEQTAHLAGIVRIHHQGSFTLPPAKEKIVLVVEGPGGMNWRYPVALSPLGGFHAPFKEEKRPTGDYEAHLEIDGAECGQTEFKLENYTLPKFQVELTAPAKTGMDEPFALQLAARYYAGGTVNKRPVAWRVTQFPYNWNAPKLPGFVFGVDARFSQQGTFQSTPEKTEKSDTDETGSASLLLDPTQEPNAQPRRYVVEATVTGDDDRTVTAVRDIIALPPFVLGIKVDRYQDKSKTAATGQWLALGPDGEPQAGRAVTLRLIKRRWHATLQAGDYSQGVAKYHTDVTEETIQEQTLTSEAKAADFSLPLKEAGVYIVQAESRDRMGRTQQVRVELFKDGDAPVTWSSPPQPGVFKVTTDKNEYNPGDVAQFILESPFQTAEALVVVEEADGHHLYEWVRVRNGGAVFSLPIQRGHTPKIPVHFLLMHGRGPFTPPPPGADPNKPATLGATAWATVNPIGRTVSVEIDAPGTVLPGAEITLTLRLKDEKGAPLSGEVTVWMVDQAVLALGKEQRLDPRPDFILPRKSRLEMRDVRGMVFGFLSFKEAPGGGIGYEAMENLLDKVTIRKNYNPVPLFQANLPVGPGGVIQVKAQLPDSLTNFKIRAKAVSGFDRFGHGTGHVKVRLPVIVQPALPRFVRPGDSFLAQGVGRVVEGGDGPGRASIRVEGLTLEGGDQHAFTWKGKDPQRFRFPVTVPDPGLDAEGNLRRRETTVILGVERSSDQARDAFSVTLPLLPDRDPIHLARLDPLVPGTPLALPALDEPLRQGGFSRSLLVSARPEALRLLSTLDAQFNYPHDCSEQRISRAFSYVAMRRLRQRLGDPPLPAQGEQAVQQTLAFLPQVTDDKGLVAFWPGQPGRIFLTAWASLFLTEAHQAGIRIDAKLQQRYLEALNRALRSDSGLDISGENYAERIWALNALARADRLEGGYAAELVRKSQYLQQEGAALTALALSRSKDAPPDATTKLVKRLNEGIVWKLLEGRPVYGGLQERIVQNPHILPSESRTIANTLRAMTAVGQEPEAAQRLLETLLRLGQIDGWGDTNANTVALLALGEIFSQSPRGDLPPQTVRLTGFGAGEEKALTLDAAHPLQHVAQTANLPGTLSTDAPGVLVQSRVRYLPVQDGAQAQAVIQGFAVRREALRLPPEGAPPVRLPLEKAGETLSFQVGDLIEEHVEVVSPEARHHVAVTLPFAAGLEPLNPALATAPPEAKPEGQLTQVPSYTLFLDDRISYY